MIEDLSAWAEFVDDLDNPIHAVFYRLLLFTGFRKGEALTLEWKHVHEDRIHLPMTKNGRSFDLPIVDLHHSILNPCPGAEFEVGLPVAQGDYRPPELARTHGLDRPLPSADVRDGRDGGRGL